MKVRLYGLTGCSHCKATADLLANNKIPYQWLDAEDESVGVEVGRLESFFNCSRYPKLILILNNSKKVFLNPSDGKRLEPSYATIEYFDSVEHILHIIKKYKDEV